MIIMYRPLECNVRAFRKKTKNKKTLQAPSPHRRPGLHTMDKWHNYNFLKARDFFSPRRFSSQKREKINNLFLHKYNHRLHLGATTSNELESFGRGLQENVNKSHSFFQKKYKTDLSAQ